MTGRSAPVVRCPNCGTKNRLRASAEGVPRCAKCQTLLPWITHATTASFEAETQAAVPVVVDFWAAWCGPCRMMQPVLERFAETHAGRVKVVEVNVDEEPELAQRWQAMSIPLLVVLRDRAEVKRVVGARPPSELERQLEPVLETTASRG